MFRFDQSASDAKYLPIGQFFYVFTMYLLTSKSNYVFTN